MLSICIHKNLRILYKTFRNGKYLIMRMLIHAVVLLRWIVCQITHIGCVQKKLIDTLPISYGNFNYKFNSEIYNMCIPELFQNRIIHLHSSYIIYHDKAILFTGPSGIGKTTQAELWRDYQGAEIINGDVTLIRKWDGRYCAFWCADSWFQSLL